MRLGKLPKDLTGVYDEIMNSINQQFGSTPQLAARTLKWMLASERPLTPCELVTAIEIHPEVPIHVKHVASCLKPSLEIEVVIAFCGGLISWDKALNVLRFVHLSVREYLENRYGEWNIIDAHLHIAESSLWVLQDSCSHTLNMDPSLLEYISHHWFRHCKSYQDLIMHNPPVSDSAKYKLNIPLLNRFLGSPTQAGTSYVKWQDSLQENSCGYTFEDLWNLHDWIHSSNPVSAIFLAAYGGLGVLLNWVWVSEGINGNV